MNKENLTNYAELYRTFIFRLAYSYVKSKHDADDITQDVFIKLYKCEECFKSDESVKAWLARVAINTAKNYLKTAWRVKRAEMPQNIATENNQVEIELYEYIKRLKPKYQATLFLHYYEGYTVKEVASIMNTKDSTVKVRLKRGRDYLRGILEEEGYHGTQIHEFL